MNKKYLIVAIPIILIIIGSIYFSNSEQQDIVKKQIDIFNQSRPIYSNIDFGVFEDLPKYDKNFVLIKRNFYDNQIKDLTKIPESVYKQPEFYPTWESNGIGWFTRHDYSRFGVHGYGTFPSEIGYSIINMSKGDSIDIYTFFRTSWGIETWQGVKLDPVYNNSLFDVKMNPDVMLLEPTFPKFYEKWTNIIQLNITAKEKIPSGTYTFSFTISSPSEKQNEEWSWYVLDKYTNNKYHDEINECKKNVNLKSRCDTLIALTQNKYVAGGQYAPSNLFTATVAVTD